MKKLWPGDGRRATAAHGKDCHIETHPTISWSCWLRSSESTITGWWLEHQFYFPIYWVANHPNWRSYFSEGWPNHQPDNLLADCKFQDENYPSGNQPFSIGNPLERSRYRGPQLGTSSNFSGRVESKALPRVWFQLLPICSMYGIFTNIYPKITPM